jgi:hypothetical protein
MARMQQALAGTFIELDEEAQKAGLVFNVNTTKYIVTCKVVCMTKIMGFISTLVTLSLSLNYN